MVLDFEGLGVLDFQIMQEAHLVSLTSLAQKAAHSVQTKPHCLEKELQSP